jgi:hypothetical protein
MVLLSEAIVGGVFFEQGAISKMVFRDMHIAQKRQVVR